MASAGASCCGRGAALFLRIELLATGNASAASSPRAATAGRSCRARLHSATTLARTFGTYTSNETWSRRWGNISRKSLSTGTRTFTSSLNPVLSKEQQHYKEARDSRDARDSKDGKESKDTKNKDSKEAKETKKQAKEKNSALIPPEVVVEYHRGLPRISIPLPSRAEKCMFTLKPITQTVGDFLDMVKMEDPAVIEASVTSTSNEFCTYDTGIKMAATNRIEALLLDDFNLIINDKVYPVSPPLHVDTPKESVRQLRDLQALVSQLYETFNAREYYAELEREVMLQLEEVKLELEPLEQVRLEIEEAAERRSRLASWGVLVLMSMQFGCLARLTWWEYSWDIMEPVTYFVTYATAMGCYIYFLMTRQEYMLPDVFRREHLIGLHKKAKKLSFDVARYNMLKDEAYELEMMLKVIRGPLHQHQVLVEQKRRERLERTRSRSSSSSSSSSSRSKSPSPSPERDSKKKTKTATNPSAVITN